MLEQCVLLISIYCVWELASIAILESGEGEPGVPLSLYQVFVYEG